MTDYRPLRERMLERHVIARGIRDPGLLDALREVPREAFVAPAMAEFAYEDTPLPIGEQTISQPYIVALMVEAAELSPGDHVLEVGAGSGYAAAVMSRLARHVYAVERHASLVEEAIARFDRLGYDNITLLHGDGSTGWPAAAPFDAILVAAGAPEPPPALREQLAIGGRLVIPVGDDNGNQRLRKITRSGEDSYDQEDLGAVRFVPLIGAQGWAEDGSRAATSHVPGSAAGKSLPALLAEAVEPLPPIDDAAFAAAFDRYADRRVVLLGEASHGTAEFYRARAAITRHLIEHHGYTLVAVEADWPDAAAINRYVRHHASRSARRRAFQRFPTWMWRNTEVEALVHWLRNYNEGRQSKAQAGFYGLDLYSMGGSIAAVLEYLDEVDPDAAAVARQRYGCLTPWQKDPAVYGRVALSQGYAQCEAAVIRQCRDLLASELDYAHGDGERFLDAAQNARLVAAAERYYRVMYYGGAESWNLRDTHMFDTLKHLLEAHGPQSKAIVWAHNSHIGDARYTGMGAERDELNIGQLCREHFGDQAALIGLGTHTGTVAAATDWDGDMEVKQVRPSRRDSIERLCHDTGEPSFLLDLRSGCHEALRRRLAEAKLERFIGVIYRPETELQSHYSPAALSGQFDAWVWFDETRAVTPLGPEHARTGMPDTWPFGL